MVKGGGSRPSVAPRTPARAPRATRAYIWRAFPPETSGPATRPRRGLAPRRPGGWERLFLCERQWFAPSNRPSLLVRPMRLKISLGRVCILRGSRTAGGPSRFETQGCAADGTADSPELWRAVTSAIMWERTEIPARLAAPPPRPTRGPAARSRGRGRRRPAAAHDRAGICRLLHGHIIRRVSPSPTPLSEPATACVRPARPTPPRFSLARIASPASAQSIDGDQLY
jgi:hypothetical protein